jgi:hypothetical protein
MILLGRNFRFFELCHRLSTFPGMLVNFTAATPSAAEPRRTWSLLLPVLTSLWLLTAYGSPLTSGPRGEIIDFIEIMQSLETAIVGPGSEC